MKLISPFNCFKWPSIAECATWVNLVINFIIGESVQSEDVDDCDGEPVKGEKHRDSSRILNDFSGRTFKVGGVPGIALQMKKFVIICKRRKFPPCRTLCSGGPRTKTDSPVWLSCAIVIWLSQPPACRASGSFLWLEIPSRVASMPLCFYMQTTIKRQEL